MRTLIRVKEELSIKNPESFKLSNHGEIGHAFFILIKGFANIRVKLKILQHLLLLNASCLCKLGRKYSFLLDQWFPNFFGSRTT